MNQIITAEVRELFVAYEIYIEAALQYRAGVGAFRKRAEAGALIALQERMQYALKRLLNVAVAGQGEDYIELRLPAVGRIGTSKIIDCPRYAIIDVIDEDIDEKPITGPGIAQVVAGERVALSNPEFSLRVHRIELDSEGQGLAPLFGELLPFRLQF